MSARDAFESCTFPRSLSRISCRPRVSKIVRWQWRRVSTLNVSTSRFLRDLTLSTHSRATFRHAGNTLDARAPTSEQWREQTEYHALGPPSLFAHDIPAASLPVIFIMVRVSVFALLPLAILSAGAPVLERRGGEGASASVASLPFSS